MAQDPSKWVWEKWLSALLHSAAYLVSGVVTHGAAWCHEVLRMCSEIMWRHKAWLDGSCHSQSRTVEKTASLLPVQNQCETLNDLYCGMRRDLFQSPNLRRSLSFHIALSYGTGMLEACRQHPAHRFDLSFQKNVDKSNTACKKKNPLLFFRKVLSGQEAWLAFPSLSPVCQRHCTVLTIPH